MFNGLKPVCLHLTLDCLINTSSGNMGLILWRRRQGEVVTSGSSGVNSSQDMLREQDHDLARGSLLELGDPCCLELVERWETSSGRHAITFR